MALSVVVALIAGCDLAASSPSPEASGAGDLIIGLSALPVLYGNPSTDMLTRRLMYSGLYRYDATYRARPDLADGPCLQSADKLRLTCHLLPATFHDGSPVTAEDVAFSYQLAISEQCRSALFCGSDDAIDRIDAPDERTIVFELMGPDPGLETTLLPNVPIERHAVVQAAYDAFAVKGRVADRKAMDRLAAAIDEELQREEPRCERGVNDAERLLSSAGAIIPEHGEFVSGEVFDDCSYANALLFQLQGVVSSIDSDGVDAIAAAYPVLGLYRQPIGTGPWKVVSRTPGREMALDAFDQYHFGRPKIDHVRLVALTEGAALERFKSGSLDWWKAARGDFGRDVRALESINAILYPILSYVALQYNLRDGRLFADLNLRKAVELCIDRKSSVDTVTNGAGQAASSAIPPPLWAHKDEPILERNVAEATKLIESSGWRVGFDGIYAKEGQRLAASVVVRDPGVGGPFGVINLLDLIKEQVAECGIDLTPYPVPRDELNNMLDNFPHLLPGGDEPFDLYLGVVDRPPDPHDPMWQSDEISSKEQPHGWNYIGFRNPDVDRVLDAARRSTNIDERTRLYHTFQDIVFDERAMLFMYWPFETTGLSNRVLTGERPLDSEYWWWQLETIELAARS